MAKRRAAFEHDQPLLVWILVVVRADCLARRELVHRAADLVGPDLRAEAVPARPVAVRIRGVVFRAGREDVEFAHGVREGSGTDSRLSGVLTHDGPTLCQNSRALLRARARARRP